MAPAWLWNGLHAKLVDGFTFTMPDTPENQAAFPQIGEQRPGVGLPIARACAVLSLATAGYLRPGRRALRRQGDRRNAPCSAGCWRRLTPNDVVVFDRCFCSFLMLALLSQRGLHVCVRLHQRRRSDFRRGRRLGPGDHLITWTRPKKPAWMTQEQYDQIPETLTLREVQFQVTVPGCRVETLTVITTLTDPAVYAREDIADLYGFRWNAELDIRAIKQTLHLDHVRCKTPEMVRRELWVTLLAYNLIRKVIATAAAVHKKQPRQLGFTLACQSLLTSWMLLATGACRNSPALYDLMLARLAANEVANRPGRIEPRVLKRRRHRYPLMQRPRSNCKRNSGKHNPIPIKELPTAVPFGTVLGLRRPRFPSAVAHPQRWKTGQKRSVPLPWSPFFPGFSVPLAIQFLLSSVISFVIRHWGSWQKR